jgi:flavin reductase (DIM6/NTAB) family NADH-FMN oxidoreductase RutF
VIGRVVGIYIDDNAIRDGMVDTGQLKPIARLGYMDYSVVDSTFTLQRPK